MMETRVYGRSATRVKREHGLQILPGQRVVGIELHRPAQMLDRLVARAALTRARRRGASASAPNSGLQPHRFAELGNRFLEPALLSERDPQDVVQIRRLGNDRAQIRTARRRGGAGDPSRRACGPSPPPRKRRPGRGGPGRYRGRRRAAPALPSAKHVGHHASTCSRSTTDGRHRLAEIEQRRHAILLDRTIVADRGRRPASLRRASAPIRRTCRRFPARSRDRRAPGLPSPPAPWRAPPATRAGSIVDSANRSRRGAADPLQRPRSTPPAGTRR